MSAEIQVPFPEGKEPESPWVQPTDPIPDFPSALKGPYNASECLANGATSSGPWDNEDDSVGCAHGYSACSPPGKPTTSLAWRLRWQPLLHALLFLTLATSRQSMAAADSMPGDAVITAIKARMVGSDSGRLDLAQSWSRLRGLPVADVQGDRLGRAEGLLIDLPAASIVSVLVAPANVYGDFQSPVPAASLTAASETQILLGGSQTNLLTAPRLPGEVSDPAAVAKVIDDSRAWFLGPQATATNPTPRQLIKAGKVLGLPVKNPAGEDLGTLTDLLIDLPRGRVFFAVVSLDPGGRHLYAVPPAALTLDPAKPSLVLVASRAKIAIEADQGQFLGPQMRNPTWAATVHRRLRGWSLTLAPTTRPWRAPGICSPKLKAATFQSG